MKLSCELGAAGSGYATIDVADTILAPFDTDEPMITVRAFEAKTHLSALLDRVVAGEEVIITKHGKPVARLVSAAHIDRTRVNEAFERLKVLRKGTTLEAPSWTALRDEGPKVSLVIEWSVALTWWGDEASAQSDALLEHMRDGGAVVPASRHLELANVLLQAETG